MIASVEQRIRRLEEQVKNLKCSYRISSSLIQLVNTESSDYELYSDSANTTIAKTLHFTPDKGTECFMNFRIETETVWQGDIIVEVESGHTRYIYPKTYARVTYSSDGSATIRINVAGMRVKTKITAIGTCPGVFSEV